MKKVLWPICFGLSAFATLLFEASWFRVLSTFLGSTDGALSVVLAAFFSGTAFGSLIATCLVRRGSRTVATYILIELLVAVCMVFGFLSIPHLGHVLAGGDGGMSLFARFAVAFAVMLLPSAFMGMAFPVFCHVLLNGHADHTHLPLWCGASALGGALGAFSSGFVVFPLFGVHATLLLAGACNGLAAALAWSAMRGGPCFQERFGPVGQAARTSDPQLQLGACWVLFVCGVSSMAAEVILARQLTMFVGGTVLSVSLVLGFYILGFAVGNRLSPVRRVAGREACFLTMGVGAMGLLFLVVRWLLGKAPWVHSWADGLEAWSLPVRAASVCALVCPITLANGVLFPAALSQSAGDVEGRASSLGVGYAVNGVGSVLGVLTGAFLLLPRLGTDTSLLVLSALLCISAGVLVVWWTFPYRVTAVVLGCTAYLLGVRLPGVTVGDLAFSVAVAYSGGELSCENTHRLVDLEGRNSTVSLYRHGDSLLLASNGLTEASLSLIEPRLGSPAEALLAAIPMLTYGPGEVALVVGHGFGTTSRILSKSGVEVRSVEYEPAILTAAEHSSVPLAARAQVEVVLEDARYLLLSEPRIYDVILSQPSHPWVIGSSGLFSQEFFELCRLRLTPGGLMGQWVNLFNMDAEILLSIFSAFFAVFPEGCVFSCWSGSSVLLFGSNRPIAIPRSIYDRAMERTEVRRQFAMQGLATYEDFTRRFLYSREVALRYADGVQPNRDSNLLPELRLSLRRGNPESIADLRKYLSRRQFEGLEDFLGGADWTLGSKVRALGY